MTQHSVSSNGLEKLDWLWIALIGLILQGAWAMRLQQPTYMDAYYYATNGQRLADGYGFTEQVIWQFLDDPVELPTPSHTYWMPLPSMLAAAGYTLVGSFEGAKMPFWILAGLLPCLSAAICLHFSGKRWQIWTAALLTASGGFYVNFFGQPSTFAPFAWAGGVCLLALAKAGQSNASPYWWGLAGLMAGFGHLIRADGVLLLLVGVLIWVLCVRARRTEIEALPDSYYQRLVVEIGGLLIGYLLVMGSWFARNLVVSGQILSTVGTQTIFLTTYDDLFAYERAFDLLHLLSWGWDNILRSKLQGLSIAGQTFVAVSCFVFLAPFVVWSWIRFRQSRMQSLRPLTWYTIALFTAMSLVFTFPGERGGLFHSSAALWPWTMALAATGIEFTVDWVAGRLSHWKPERAKRVFAGLFISFAFVVSFVVGSLRAQNGNDAQGYTEIGAMLPEDAVVMVGNAPGFYYHTGLPSVSVPNEPTEILLRVAKRYKVTHLILDKDRPQPLIEFYNGELQHPAIQWVGDFEDRKLYVLRDLDE